MGRFVTLVAALVGVVAGLTAVAVCAHGSTATVVPALTGSVDRGIQWPQMLSRQADGHAHDDHDKCESSACVRNWKLGFIAVLFVEGIIGGFVPYGLKYLPRFDVALHMANAFSGGIFLATGMLHILPEAIELMDGIDHDGGEEHHEEPGGEEAVGGEEPHDEHEISFPTVYACAMAFFFVILFVEHLLLRRVAGAHSHLPLVGTAEEHEKEGFHAVHPAADSGAPAGKDGRDTALGVDAATTGPVDGSGSARIHSLDAQTQNQEQTRDLESTSGGDEALHSYGNDESFEERRQRVAASNKRFFSSNFFRALLAIVAVAFHSVFESLSLGLASDFSSALSVFIAIAAHKWATSIALGVKCEKEQLRLSQFASLIVLFAAVTPLAGGLGLLISDVDTTVRGVLFALSAGIFLYIGAFEVPSEEFMVHQRWLWGKFFSYVSGAIVITIITAILVATDVH
ncbi:hypothetical protein MMPV_000933 [Pyropia vietnamensis]